MNKNNTGYDTVSVSIIQDSLLKNPRNIGTLFKGKVKEYGFRKAKGRESCEK